MVDVSKYITFEGSPGCGKTTIMNEVFKSGGFGENVVRVCEPDKDSEIGLAIRQIFQGLQYAREIRSRTGLFLVNASRVQLLESMVIPALEAGKTVASDRSCESSRAIQVAEGLSREAVDAVIALATGGVEPGHVLIFDAPVEVLLERLRRAGRDDDRFERGGGELLDRVRDNYLARVREEPGRIRLIDANRPLDDVVEEALGIVGQILGVELRGK